uniref:THAP domain-containing protein 11 n=1 Tax=Lygus hesperus TaxID=30085 RepID=A0A0A9X794_LYGHE
MSAKGSKNICCVPGCGNMYTNSNVTLYSFPGKPYELERKYRWVQAVNRLNADGSLWEPSKYSKICSHHFVGGQMSNIADHPAYVPSIFPKTSRKRRREKKTSKGAPKKRQKQIQPPSVRSDALDEKTFGSHARDASVQVHFALKSEMFEFTSTFVNSDCATQCNIVANDLDKSGFHGYESVSNDSDSLKELTNTSKDKFEFLLSLISDKSFRALANPNVLLMFLMKMRLGISFGCLGILFSVHRTTAMGMFTTVLEVLSLKTKDHIFWPSKVFVSKTLPEAFKEFYPHARAIVTCTEIEAETPSGAHRRMDMYSSSKSAFTFKFLVGFRPNGLVSFTSKCYGGKQSDFFIAKDSGLLHLLEEGDVLLADKEFSELKDENSAIIAVPPISHYERVQYTEEDILKTKSIVSIRILVERCVNQISLFKILKFVPTELFPHLDNIVHVCCTLANFTPPILKEKKAEST